MKTEGAQPNASSAMKSEEVRANPSKSEQVSLRSLSKWVTGK